MSLDYAKIAPLIAQKKTEGRAIRVTFLCPKSGFKVESLGELDPLVGPLSKRGLKGQVAREAYSMIERAMGQTPASWIPAHPTDSAFDIGPPSASDEQEAVVRAFQNVESFFAQDPLTGEWVAANLLGADRSPAAVFVDKLLAAHPVRHENDRRALALVLAEIAKADGALHPREQAMIGRICPDFAEWAGDPISLERALQEASPGSRDGILLLANLMALADGDYSEAERRAVSVIADRFGIGVGRAEQIRVIALRGAVGRAVQRFPKEGRPHQPSASHPPKPAHVAEDLDYLEHQWNFNLSE